MLTTQCIRHRYVRILLFLLAPLVGLGLLLAWLPFKYQQQQSIELQQEVINRTANEIRIRTHSIEDRLQRVGQLGHLLKLSSKDQFLHLSSVLSHRDKHHQDIFEEIAVLGSNGMEMMRVSRVHHFSIEDMRNRTETPEYHIPFTQNSIYYSPIHIDNQTNEPLLNLGIPIINPRTGRVATVIVAKLRVNKIFGSIINYPLGEKGHVYLTDKKGMVVAHNNPSIVLSGILYSSYNKSGILPGLNRGKVILTSKKLQLGNQDFWIVAERPIRETLALTFSTLKIILAFLVIFFLLLVFIAFLLSRQLIKPIEELATTANSINAGDFSQRAPLETFGEFGVLAKAFNNMTDKLLSDIKRREKAEKTALKNEKKYRTLLENLPQKIFLKDCNLTYLSCNKNFADDVQLSPEDIVGKSDFDFFPQEVAEKYQNDDQNIISTRCSATFEESYFYEGKELTVNTVKTPIFDEDGTVIGVLGIFWDITKRKATEVELEKYRHQLEKMVHERTTEVEEAHKKLAKEMHERLQAEEAKREIQSQLFHAQKMESLGRLAAGISHDFNNLINIINGFIENSRHLLNPESQMARNLSGISNAAKRAADIVKQVLIFSKDDKTTTQPVLLQNLIEEIVNFHQVNLPAHIKIQQNIDRACRPVAADQGKTHQVIMNLFTNALHAMQEMGDVLEINLSEDDGAQYVKLTIRDNGTGMTPETAKRLFEPYYSTKNHGEGMGLGLFVTHSIIKSYGGEIMFESIPNKGTTFTLLLPTIDAEVVQEAKGKEVSGRTPAARILFVDDEKINLSNWMIAFKQNGLKVEGYTDPTEALKVFQDRPEDFNIIITDQLMPRLNGTELASEAKKVRADIPIILVSGWIDDITPSDHGNGAVIQEILRKPHELQDLLGAISRNLSKKVETGDRSTVQTVG